MRKLDRLEVLEAPSREEALEYAAAHIPGLVVELDLQMIGRHTRGLARRLLVVPCRSRLSAHAPHQPGAQRRQRKRIADKTPKHEDTGPRQRRNPRADTQLPPQHLR